MAYNFYMTSFICEYLIELVLGTKRYTNLHDNFQKKKNNINKNQNVLTFVQIKLFVVKDDHA